ncbi:glycoside hydrolase family 3 protein [Actinoalloteichus spitiensis]|uniref:glycoside hydrolase family 3 protein n=1 Tax=Actinoalloteichus spitiensis TaxID=252394 RepID=UPI00036E4E29|nr:glycoside hydrolase family 3 protein [Actinoalloteichus spitiensis]
MGTTRRSRQLLALGVGAALLAGCAGGGTPDGSESEAPGGDGTADAMTEWIDETIAGMSLEEKVGQLFVTYVYGTSADTAHDSNLEEFGLATPEEIIQRYHLGGIIHFSWTDSLENPRQVAELSNGVQDAALSSGAGVPLTISIDQEQGAVLRFGAPATEFPGSMALGAGRSVEDARTAAAITGQELRAVGITQNFAPVADVNVNPANPVIGVRSFSSDPELAADFVTAQVEGYQDSDVPERTVSSSIKHFPGHGDTNVDSHHDLPVIEHTREEWEELDAPPFRAAIAAGADSVMSGHLMVPGLDDSGMPATLSPAILTGMLRDELGFDGLIYTDSLQMEGVRSQYPDDRIPVLALLAGADQLLMPQHLDVAITGVLEAVRSGELTEERIEESVRRVLRAKWERGIVAEPHVDPDHAAAFVGSEEHLSSAREITDRTVTVLRNDADLLPLDTAPERVLVAGWDQATTGALAERLTERGAATTTLPNDFEPSQAQIRRATTAAGEHDLTVVLTNGAWQDGRSGQRDLVRALAATGRPVVAVAVRDPYDAAYVEEAETWVATHSFNRVTMESLARVLLGETSPQGSLPVPVPRPDGSGDRYPFGHGLSW